MPEGYCFSARFGRSLQVAGRINAQEGSFIDCAFGRIGRNGEIFFNNIFLF